MAVGYLEVIQNYVCTGSTVIGIDEETVLVHKQNETKISFFGKPARAVAVVGTSILGVALAIPSFLIGGAVKSIFDFSKIVIKDIISLFNKKTDTEAEENVNNTIINVLLNTLTRVLLLPPHIYINSIKAFIDITFLITSALLTGDEKMKLINQPMPRLLVV